MKRRKGALEILWRVPLQYEEEDCHLYKPKVSPDWILFWGEKGQSQKYWKSHETEHKGGVLWTEGVRHLSAYYSLNSLHRFLFPPFSFFAL